MLKKKKAMVLSGGGTRGVYENGAVKALCELGMDDWDLVTGTSVGALNAALIVQKDYEKMDDLWANLQREDIIRGELPTDFTWESLFNNAGMRTLLSQYVHSGGADISPFIERAEALFDPEGFMKSDTDFGCVTVQFPLMRPLYVTKHMMADDGLQWLISSASAYPVFPVHKFDKGEFIDGGYYDNLPVDEALRLGAEEIIVIDLHHRPQHPQYMNRSFITYICPTSDTGTFMDFSSDTLNRLGICGYNDVMKVYGRYAGCAYTFDRKTIPAWFDSFERELAIIENNAFRAGAVSELLRSDQPVMDRLMQNTCRKVLSREEVFYSIMDELLTMAGADIRRILTYEEAADRILARFAPCAYEDYRMPSVLNAVDLRNYFGRTDTASITGALVHMSLYPGHAVIPQRAAQTMYPYECALAAFVLKLMYELGGRR